MLKRVFAAAVVILALAFIVSIWVSFPGITHAKEKRKDGSLGENRPAAVFTNSAPITIIDAAPASLYPSTIAVSGLSGTIPAVAGSVKVTLNGFSHTFPDDVGIVLVGPTGAALLLQDGAGDNPDMTNVTYTLSDSGASNLPNLTAWTAGTYKPTSYIIGDSFPSPGPGTAYANPGPEGGGTATFSSVFAGTNPNGDWKLFVVDFVGGDEGSISGGWTLEIVTASPPANDAPVDMNGDGKSDYVVVRSAGGTSGQITWWTMFSANAPIPAPSEEQALAAPSDGFPTTPTDWGIASDFFVPADYDGDGKDDFAVWRPGTNAVFYIVRSATATMYTEQFGQSGDDPTVVGDYTGDNRDDIAVYREGVNPGDQSTWYYRSIGSPPGVQSIPWGQSGDVPAPGDYDGDSKYDFVIQRPDSNGVNGRFWVREADGLQYSQWFGLATDLVVPGDYDDDGKTDFAVARDDGGTIRWDFEPSGTAGVTVVTDTWGVTATDTIAQADHDGDGKTEYVVWRSGSPGIFYIMTPISRRIWTQPWGTTGDIPAASYNTH